MSRMSKKQATSLIPVDAETPDIAQETFLPSRFKVPRRDANNNSVHINFYTASYYLKIAQRLQGKVPDFSNLSDVFACALHYGLLWIQNQDVIGYTSVQSQLNVWVKICQEAELDEDLLAAQEKLKATVERKIKHNAAKEAKRVVAMALNAAEQMPPGYYRDRTIEFLQQEFGYLFGDKQAIHQDTNTGMVPESSVAKGAA